MHKVLQISFLGEGRRGGERGEKGENMCMTITKLLTAAIPLLGKFCDAFWKQSKNTSKTRLSQQKEGICSVKRREISSELYRQVKLCLRPGLAQPACLSHPREESSSLTCGERLREGTVSVHWLQHYLRSTSRSHIFIVMVEQ